MTLKFILSRQIIATFIGIAILGLASCGEETTTNSNNGNDTIVGADSIKTINVPVDIDGKNVMFSVPSPVQTMMLIKKTGAYYNPEILNTPKSAPNYVTNYQKALNIGIYGADLGYVILYDQSQEALLYLDAIKKIADELGLSGVFDLEAVKKLEENIEYKDSLLRMHSDLYKETNSYLKSNNQEEIGLLILAGGWIEGLYFSSEVLQKSSVQEIRDRIGEQKNTLGNLIKALSQYQDSSDIIDFTGQLKDLAIVFDGIQKQYTFKESTINVEKKISTINSISKVIITQEQIDEITEKVKVIRNRIVGQNI